MNPVKYDMHTGVLGSRYLNLIELSSSLLVIDLQTQKVEILIDYIWYACTSTIFWYFSSILWFSDKIINVIQIVSESINVIMQIVEMFCEMSL